MLRTRIAVGATAVILGITGVALANTSTETETGVSTPAASSEATTRTETSSAVSLSTVATIDDNSTTSVTVDDSSSSDDSMTDNTSTTNDSTPTTLDDSGNDDSGSDDSDERESRSILTLELRTYTVADAGTVTLNGMTLVAVDANPGWTVEIDEASSERIKIEFEKGETDVEFELRSDGELRIRSHD